MADENKLSTKDLIEDDGTLDGIIRGLETIIGLFDTLNKSIKNEGFSKWAKSVESGSNEEKAALSGLMQVAERLIKVTEQLSVVRSDSYKQLKNAEAIVKSANRELEKEAEINNKVVGSYTRYKLELQNLVEQYKNANDAKEKFELGGKISDLSAKIKAQNTQLNILTGTLLNASKARKEEYQSALGAQAMAKEEISAINAKAKAYAASTQAYKDNIAAQKELKNARLEAISGIKTEGVENITQTKISSMTYEQLEATYKQLGIAVNNLTVEQIEGTDALEKYKNAINLVGDALEKYDKAAGRTTGRMSSRQREWNGLTNSVYQITREIPNLAVRVDTFFLAISNNIPIFLDEFKRARTELGSFKKAIASTFSAFLKGSVLGLLLFALTKFSELRKMWDGWVNTLEDGTLKVGAFYRSMEGHVKNASSTFVKQIYTIRMLSKEWKKANAEQRSNFLYKYKEQIDATGLAITNLNEAENAFSANTDVVVEAYIARTKAAAAAALAEDKYKEAVENAILAEGAASEALGRDINEVGLRKLFAEQYGITDEKQIKTGKFRIDKETLGRVIEDYEKAYTRASNRPAVLFNVRGQIRALRELNKLKELYDSASDGVINLSSSVAEWVAVANEADKGSLTMAKHLTEMTRMFAQGDQAAEKSADYMSDWSDSIDKAGVSLSDLSKKINDFSLKSLKSYNDSLLELMSNPAYRAGGVTIELPKYKIDEASGIISMEKASEKITSSFGKDRANMRLTLQESVTEIDNFLEELAKLKLKAGEEFSGIIDQAIFYFDMARRNKIKAIEDSITQNELEEYASRAKTFAESLSLRLEAIKDGSDEELELRKRLIRANMQAEIAENATLEPIKQKSVAAIRAKYRLEEERAEREYIIKRNSWRKQDLDNEQAYVNQYLDIYAHNQADLERIAMQSELAENAELIEAGQVSREAIIEKYSKRIEKIYDDHRAKVLSGEKSFWNLMQEFEVEGSYEALAAQLRQYDIELEAEKLQYKELIEVMPEYGRMLDELYEKRKRLARGQFEMGMFEKGQDIEAVVFSWRDQIGEQQQSLFDLEQEWAMYNMQITQYEKGQLDLMDEEVDALYARMTKVGKEIAKLTGWRGAVARVAEHGLAGLIQMKDKDKNGKDIWRDLSSEEYDAIEAAHDSLRNSIDSVIDSYMNLSQAAYDSAKAQVDAARMAYEAELEARANGYANNVEQAKQELLLEKRKAQQKEQIMKQSQRLQERINTATQVSDLITGSAEILKAFAATPYIAYALIAGMWGMFGYAKLKAAQVASTSSTYGSGGYELAVGGSHASGNDIKTGIHTKRGSNMVIEGGEGVGVFSKRAVNRYGDIIPSVVDSINGGTYGLDDYSPMINGMYSGLADDGSAYSSLHLLDSYNRSVDLSTIEGLLNALVGKQISQPIVLGDGSIYERKGNRVTITRKG